MEGWSIRVVEARDKKGDSREKGQEGGGNHRETKEPNQLPTRPGETGKAKKNPAPQGHLRPPGLHGKALNEKGAAKARWAGIDKERGLMPAYGWGDTLFETIQTCRGYTFDPDLIPNLIDHC